MYRTHRSVLSLVCVLGVGIGWSCGPAQTTSRPSVTGTTESGLSSPAASNDGPIHYCVFLDETASDAAQWGNSVIKAAELVGKSENGKTLRSAGIIHRGDLLTVIGVDEKSYDADDVRFNTHFAYKGWEFQSQCVKAIKEISSLHIREHCSGYTPPGANKPKGFPRGTDLEGALDYATQLISPGERVRLILLSDLQDYPATATVTTPHHFPAGTSAVCLFVQPPPVEHRANATDQTFQRWMRYLQSLGVSVSPASFTLVGVSKEKDVFGLFPN
jgi:hypothetical protein